MYGMPRGILNNNPLNIRISNNPWKGKIIPSKDKSFEQFDNSIDGIRAGAKLLSNYYRLHGLSTIKEIVTRWAPPTENDTNSYISDVCIHMDVGPDNKINLDDPTGMAELVMAIINHENGEQPYLVSDVMTAVKDAL